MYPWYTLDPHEAYFYSEDWSDAIGDEDPITSSTWDSDPQLLLSEEDYSGAITTVMVAVDSSARVGEVYRIWNDIQAGDQKGHRTIYFKVVNL